MERNASKLIVVLIVLMSALAFFLWPAGDGKKNEKNSLDEASILESRPSNKGVSPRGENFKGGEPSKADKEARELMGKINAYYSSPGEVELSTLVPYLDHADQHIVNNTLDLLVFMAKSGFKEKDIFSLLASISADSNNKLREEAMIKAAMLGRDEMLPIIASYIGEQSDDLNQNDLILAYQTASRALSAMRNQDSVPFIKDLLDKTDEPDIRFTNYQTLAALGTSEAIDLLMLQAESTQGMNQINSALALARTESSEGFGFLSEAIETDSISATTVAKLAASPQAVKIFSVNLNAPETTEKVKLQLLNKLARFAPNGNDKSREKMTKEMVHFIGENDELILKMKAMDVIDEISAETTVEIMPSFFDAEEVELRRKAVDIFASYTNASNYQILEKSLWDSDQKIRRVAISAMGMYMGKQDVNILKKASEHEDKFLQQQANKILQQLEIAE